MTIGSVKAGDVVHVDKKGRRFHALVTGKIGIGAALVTGNTVKAGDLTILPFTRETYRTASAREVVGIYRRAKGSV